MVVNPKPFIQRPLSSNTYYNVILLQGDKQEIQRFMDEQLDLEAKENKYIPRFIRPVLNDDYLAKRVGKEIENNIDTIRDEFNSSYPDMALVALNHAELIGLLKRLQNRIQDFMIENKMALASEYGEAFGQFNTQLQRLIDTEPENSEDYLSIFTNLESLLITLQHEEVGYLVPDEDYERDQIEKTNLNLLTHFGLNGFQLSNWEQSWVLLEDDLEDKLLLGFPSKIGLTSADFVELMLMNNYNVDLSVYCGDGSRGYLSGLSAEGKITLSKKEPSKQETLDLLDVLGLLDIHAHMFGWTHDDIYPDQTDDEYIAESPAFGIH